MVRPGQVQIPAGQTASAARENCASWFSSSLQLVSVVSTSAGVVMPRQLSSHHHRAGHLGRSEALNDLFCRRDRPTLTYSTAKWQRCCWFNVAKLGGADAMPASVPGRGERNAVWTSTRESWCPIDGPKNANPALRCRIPNTWPAVTRIPGRASAVSLANAAAPNAVAPSSAAAWRPGPRPILTGNSGARGQESPVRRALLRLCGGRGQERGVGSGTAM